ncbi:protein of unknown function DUF1508 [Clostridium beijerinckii NCIMB 8052]|uniref:DUF1508 domain-containing protein n=2 Tax=Clostridium beijerinckii TaxID=1520 RepID=A6LT43_CLOB8|nr:protein of unknown function DUF1508 [Clostridium beijerinckii NCIMB 8052]AIU03238.1 hypothetical protein Cbs_1343 [Clostridium beijerinckii ATCC 35702]
MLVNILWEVLEMARFEIKKSSNDQYYFVLKANNGQVILQSETYTSKQNCNNCIKSIKENAPDAEVADLT